MKRICAALCLLWLLPGSGRAGSLLYARANGDYQSKTQAGRYSALNLLDGDPSTVWCSQASGQGAEIDLVFHSEQEIDKIAFSTGNQSSRKAFAAFTRVKKILLLDGEMSHELMLADKFGVQNRAIEPTMQTRRLVIKLKAAYRGGQHRHACLSDIVFYHGHHRLNKKDLKVQIKAARRDLTLIDSWRSGSEKTRNRELIFGLRGRYQYIYTPTEPNEEVLRKEGTWRHEQGQLQIQLGREWLPVRVSKDSGGLALKLRIDSHPSLPLGMAGTYLRRRETLN